MEYLEFGDMQGQCSELVPWLSKFMIISSLCVVNLNAFQASVCPC